MYKKKKRIACIENAFYRQSYAQTKQYFLILPDTYGQWRTNENKVAMRKHEEVAAQPHDPHRVNASHIGALYYFLNIPPGVWIKYTFFFFKSK